LGTHGSAMTAADQAYGVLYRTLQQQAGLWAYVDQFRFLFLVCLAVVPFVFLFKRSARKLGPEAAAH
jgi:MFS transporter, DHA2 family, multidrug resistance protein